MTDMPENLDRPFRLSNTRLRNAAGFLSLGLSSKTRNGRTTMGIEARTISLRLGVIGVGLLLLCAFASSSMAADLKIGFTFSLTGGTDDAGKGARMGAELALAEYNERGGYKGQMVEAIIYDDETKPAKGVENVTRLITRDKVFAIVGPVNSGVALAGRTSCRRPRPFSSNDD